MNMKDRTIFAGLLPASPAKPKQGKATFSVHVRYHSGTSSDSYGTKRDCMSQFRAASNNPNVSYAFVERSAVNDHRTIAFHTTTQYGT